MRVRFTLELERRAKAAGVWGMGRKLTLQQEGDDLVLHIPSDLVRHLKLTRGKRLAVHLEGTERIVVELEG